jgi:hypothetical protein
MSAQAESIARLPPESFEDHCLVRIITWLALRIRGTIGIADGLVRVFLGVACDG